MQLAGTVQEIAKSVEPKSYTDPSKVVKLKVAIDRDQGAAASRACGSAGSSRLERLPNVVVVPVEAVFVKPDGPVAYRKRGAASSA